MGWTISFPRLSSGGISVSSLYGALQQCWSSHGISVSFDLAFTVIPKSSSLVFTRKLPYSTGSRSTIELPRNIVNTDKLNFITAKHIFQAAFSLIYICASLINTVASRQPIISLFSSRVPSCKIYLA